MTARERPGRPFGETASTQTPKMSVERNTAAESNVTKRMRDGKRRFFDLFFLLLLLLLLLLLVLVLFFIFPPSGAAQGLCYRYGRRCLTKRLAAGNRRPRGSNPSGVTEILAWSWLFFVCLLLLLLGFLRHRPKKRNEKQRKQNERSFRFAKAPVSSREPFIG